MKYDAPDKLREIAGIFSSHSYSLYLVGGAVRDFLLGRKNDDYDLTTSATPDEVKSMFRRTIDTGIKHGTVTVIYKGEHYEITTFRTEGDYTDSRHPDSVTFVRSLEEDLKRRDFTINALAVDILTGSVIDMHGGIEDLENRTIRAIGEPEERFHEDALRMMRACRFSSKLGFTIEEKTLSAIKDLHPAIRKVSVERIKEEMDKLLLSRCPVQGLGYLEETGLLGEIIPGLNLTDTILDAVEKAQKEKLPLSAFYAILFSDMDEEKVSGILSRLRSSNSEKEDVCHIVRTWKYDEGKNTPYDARIFIHDNGKKILPSLFAVRKSLRAFTQEDEKFIAAVENEIGRNSPVEIKDLAVRGTDLRGIVPPGPEVGKALSYLLEKVIEKPEYNTKEKLLGLVREANLCS